jgi:hypothetical protein
MPRQLKPKTRDEMFRKVLQAWYYTNKELIRVVNSNNKDYEMKALKNKYDEWMQLWEDLKI